MEELKVKTGTVLRIPPLKGILLFNLLTLIIAISIIIPNSFHKDGSLYFNFILTAIVGAIWLIFLIVTIVYFTRYNYYIIQAKGFEHVRFNQKKTYTYNNIVFIDEIWSEKHKRIYLLTNEGIERFFSFDKEVVLYRLLKQNCKNLISPQEALFRFPRLKISVSKEEKEILREEEKREKILEKEALRSQKKKNR